MKIDQKNTTNKNTLSMTPPHPSNMPHTQPSPSDCTAGNYPELAVRPRMNSRSEANTLHCVRTPLTLHPSCHASVCLSVHYVYCFLPPYSSVDPSSTAADATECDYYVDDPSTTTELPGKRCPFPSPRYRLSTLYFIYCTRHCCCYVTSYSTA